MSEPIQSIAQNNYILHNIDAKKLYVQEPLFTANSGDAVYVGWRPDETVLWSATALTDHTTACNLSEPITNFEQIQIMFQTNNNNTFYCNYPSNPSFIPVGTEIVGNNTTVFHKYAQFSIGNDGSSLTRQYCCEHSNSNTPAASDVIWLYKVVGINRKENA